MYLCYLDESGGYEAPDSRPDATPVMAIVGVVVSAASVPALTRDFLALKRQYFPGRFAPGRVLSHILTEVKGSEILQMTRSSSRNSDNHAGLQIADLVASILVFPMAIAAYCKPAAGAVHGTPRYDEVRKIYRGRLRPLQYRYRDEAGKWRGGLVVSDKVAHKDGSHLFGK